MLIRFTLSNYLSFEDSKEFNMLPTPKYRRLDRHKYNIQGFDILKMASVYGANGAGKSNLIKALSTLKSVVIKEELPGGIQRSRFKLNGTDASLPQVLAVEFFQADKAFYYALEIFNDYIKTEELYFSGLGKAEDRLIFERTTNEQGACKIKFLDQFERDKESQVLKNVIEKNLAKPGKPILKMLTTLNNPFLEEAKPAFQWFDETLEIIYPDSKPGSLTHRIDIEEGLKGYAEEIMCSLDIGISSLKTDKKSLRDFFGEDDEDKLNEFVKKVEDSPKKMIRVRTKKGDEMVVVKEKDDFFVKQLKLEHQGKNNSAAAFDLGEESDGTLRLLDFIPAFRDLITKRKVFVIDEIERSVHPLLIKELIRKFSMDDKTMGQLIFSTHESNLLDQEIFRQDEIWFVKKNKHGSTALYSLSDFKEHNTIDIQKGYLNGRYGSIPFLGNLQDLNWHKYDS